MPKSTPQKLRYQKAYNAKPANVNLRENNNQARQAAIRAGRAHVGDGTEVDHIKPQRKGGTNAPGNLRVIKEAKNAAWRKGKRGYDR